MDPPGYALNFTGGQRVEKANPSNLPTGAITIEAWIKLNAYLTWASIVDRYASENWDAFSLGLDTVAGNKLMFQWNNYGGSWPNTFTGDIVLELGKWYHVAVSSNGSSAFICVNGVLDMTANVGALGDSGSLIIGANLSANDEYFNGQIDEVRIWNYARTKEEINNSMYNIVDPVSAGLVTYYRFDDDTAGTTLSDLTSSANHGTLVNYPAWVESYAMVVPVATNATDVQYYEFTANWTQPVIGIVDGYYIDVATDSNFTAIVPGYDGLYVGNTTSKIVDSLNSSQTCYYRICAYKASVGKGAYSNSIQVATLSIFT